jgi:hypothetical protein
MATRSVSAPLGLAATVVGAGACVVGAVVFGGFGFEREVAAASGRAVVTVPTAAVTARVAIASTRTEMVRVLIGCFRYADSIL